LKYIRKFFLEKLFEVQWKELDLKKCNLKIMRELEDVIVDKVSLVTEKHRPAVEKAESRFSIFKNFKKTSFDLEKLEKIESVLR
jgi:hypothetical protein